MFSWRARASALLLSVAAAGGPHVTAAPPVPAAGALAAIVTRPLVATRDEAAAGPHTGATAVGRQPGRSPANGKLAAAARRVGVYSLTAVRQYARGTDAFTQGLVFHRGSLFEGTGLYGQSVLRETVLADGVQRVLRSRPLPEGLELSSQQRLYQAAQLVAHGYSRSEVQRFKTMLFGEGIALKGSRIYQLTWVEGVCLVWNISNWTTPARVLNYEGEGWGLTHDGTHLIMSDGSATLTFRDPESFAVVRKIPVKDPRSGAPVDQLNELEFVGGRVFANIYKTRRIAIIDPKTGVLQGLLYADGSEIGAGRPSLLPAGAWDQLDDAGNVLNGIAYDPVRDHLFLTGKRWPTIFEVTLSKVRDQ